MLFPKRKFNFIDSHENVYQLPYSGLLFPPKKFFLKNINYLDLGTGDEELDRIIKIAGYVYDPFQDIFYSTLNCWQRNVGYCQLYDEAAALLGIIIDCEPILFDFDNRKWMISFWKGQYGMVCGGEIGVYTNGEEIYIPGIYSGTFYSSVNDSELLEISCVLKKNGQILFTRSDKHWWLTGFKLGEFAQPSELTMDIKITLTNNEMLNAFVEGLKKAGYASNEYSIQGNTVIFTFDKPHTKQPVTRTPMTDKIIQDKNKILCEMYQEITHNGRTVREKLKILKQEEPDLYEKALRISSNQKFFKTFYILIIIAMYLLTSFSKGSDYDDKAYLSKKKAQILTKLEREIEELDIK